MLQILTDHSKEVNNNPPSVTSSSTSQSDADPVQSSVSTSSRPPPPPPASQTPHGPSQLPPRLQRKQRQVEEEQFMKYYRPMDYMRQTQQHHTITSGDARLQPPPPPKHDIHSRGAVKHRTLWTEDSYPPLGQSARNGDQQSVVRENSLENREVNETRPTDTSTNRGHQKSVKFADIEQEIEDNDDQGHPDASIESSMSALSLSRSSDGVQSAGNSIHRNNGNHSGRQVKTISCSGFVYGSVFEWRVFTQLWFLRVTLIFRQRFVWFV